MKTITKWSIKTWSNLFATWVAILGAIVGGVFAIIQYEHNSAAEKVKETLKYVERFNSGQVQKARLQIEKSSERHIDDFNRAAIRGDKALSISIMDMIRREGLSEHADVVIDFFDNVYICTYLKLCDDETTQRFFGPYNHNLQAIFHPYIMNRRQHLNNDSIGCGIESIAKSYRKHMAISDISCSATYSR